MQFRAVVGWKQEVRACLRRVVYSIGHEGSAGAEARGLLGQCAVLQERLESGARKPIISLTGAPLEPAAAAINAGLDVFRKKLQGCMDDRDT